MVTSAMGRAAPPGALLVHLELAQACAKEAGVVVPRRLLVSLEQSERELQAANAQPWGGAATDDPARAAHAKCLEADREVCEYLGRVLAGRAALRRKNRFSKVAAGRWSRTARALSRSAPRRLAARRHRRAARPLQKTGTDDGGSPEPPPSKLVLAAAGALLAGFACGALAAVVLP